MNTSKTTMITTIRLNICNKMNRNLIKYLTRPWTCDDEDHKDNHELRPIVHQNMTMMPMKVALFTLNFVNTTNMMI